MTASHHRTLPQPPFPAVLAEMRNRRRLSQSRLAEAAGFDHSYVSRLEAGNRMPTRDAVIKLSDALQLLEPERDGFLASAGFMPGNVESLFAAEPVLSEVIGLLQDVQIPTEIREDVRQMVSLLVRQARRASEQLNRAAA